MRAAVIGAGVVGLSSAWALVEDGHEVTVHDPAPASGATYAAAGMIAPAGEAWFGEEDLLRLGVASAAMWPEYAARLSALSGVDVDLRSPGSLQVGRDASDLAVLRRTLTLLTGLGVPAAELTAREARALEPTLSDRVCGGVLLPEDRHVNPRLVAAALLRLLGDRVVPRPATPDSVDADVVVLCTGTALPGTHPVRGEVLRVRCPDPPERVVRGLVHGEPVYVVPRAGDETVVGATSEPASGPAEPTVGGVFRLLAAARALVPSLEEATVLEVVARDRPGTPDNGPLLGRVSPRVVVAGGHYRGGVLLAPVTAATVRALVAGDAVPPEAARFHPSRFDQEALLT